MTGSRAGRRLRLLGVCCSLAATAVVSFSIPVASAKARPSAADESAPHRRPVRVVAPERIKIRTAAGEAQVPAYVSIASAELNKPHPEVRYAVVLVHGRLRDADKYFDLGMRAARASNAHAETLVIAPQLLSTEDAARHDLPANVARWKTEAWLSGDSGKAPFSISSFEVMDGILAQLSDRVRYPNLERIVVAAHSGGAQFVQRYAVVGRADQVITAAGLQPYTEGMALSAGTVKSNVMRVRYVAANPSSYLYFDATRPVPSSHCADFDKWRYGINDPVAYAQGANMKALEQRYLTRRVIYLLGGNDVDPNHSALDKTCMAEMQGANRLERGTYYFAHVQKRARLQNITLRHTRVEVPGVAHDADRMFNSPCGKAALFDAPGCDMKTGESMVAPLTAVVPAVAAAGGATGTVGTVGTAGAASHAATVAAASTAATTGSGAASAPVPASATASSRTVPAKP